MLELRIEPYQQEIEQKWDKFVEKQSMNGTFQQTRRFLNYHYDRGRFKDQSLVVYKGNDTIVAVIPANLLVEDGKKIFFAHQGSTFGGIVMAENFHNIEHVEALLDALEIYLKEQGYDEAWFKNTNELFAKGNCNLIDYEFFKHGYRDFNEISFYIDFADYKEEIADNFTSGRRRDFRYSQKQGFTFRELSSENEIVTFYDILCENLRKFDTVPVHTLEELLEFQNERLTEETGFYGVFLEDKMISGSMIFRFGKKVFHTQYLAARQDYLKQFPMNFMDTCLIETAKKEGFQYFSFGTSTAEHGLVLNKPLAQFKEGFGTQYTQNKLFHKVL